MRFIFIAGCFFILIRGHSQIINVESLRLDTDSNGFAGKETFSLNITQNTIRLISINNNLVAQWKSKKNTFLFLNDLNFTFSENTNFEKKGFFHLRYNYEITDFLTIEAFTQYQVDIPLRIQNRWLLGVGPRLSFIKTDKKNLVFGSLLMYECDNELGTGIVNRDFRLSNYLSLATAKADRIKISALIYYQPRLDYWNDFRISGQLQMELRLYKSLWFAFNGGLFYDSFQYRMNLFPGLPIKLPMG